MEKEVSKIKITELDLGKPLRKILMFTDIHFGKKNNSIVHNQDCLDFIDFVVANVKKDPEIDAIAFLGDWFENRNAINVMTLDAADRGADKLDELGIPIFFDIGNHDLYHRHTRVIYSPKPFKDKKNFIIVDHFTKVNGDLLFTPFLFHDEYPQMVQFNGKTKYAFGHFEFKNFVLTGTSNIMEKGPEHTMFNDFTYIFSGHYHKRQIKDNTIYIGNTFPMDYGDVGDSARGVCILDTRTDDVKFVDWSKCPMYFRVNLSTLIEGDWTPVENSRITCTKDIEISYTEVQALKEEFIKAFSLREFKIDEKSQERKDAIAGEGQELDIDALDSTGMDDIIQKLIASGVQKTASIDPVKLAEEYAEL